MGDIYIPEVDYWQGVYVLLAWLAFLWLLARNGGWSALARLYPAQDWNEDDFTWKSWQSGKMQGWLYPACLWVGLNDEGMLLKTGPDILLRFSHPPLFIPWQAVHVNGQAKALGQNFQVLSLEGVPSRLWLSDKALKPVSEIAANRTA